MKRFLAVLILCMVMAILAIVGINLAPSGQINQDYLRIHIRANSNDYVDQDIKYLIKDKIVEYLTPIISSCKTKAEFQQKLSQNIPQIVCISNELLAQNNFDYKSSASIKNEFFPTRTYDNLTLTSGYYDALIVNLGSGKGDNWWCVVYPPLCFINGENNVYRSRMLEVIKKFFGA